MKNITIGGFYLKESMVFFMLALISYGISKILISLSKVEYIESGEANGKIDKILHSEYGNTYFKISFNAKGKEYSKCSSEYYSSTKGKYKTGDDVRIKYTISKKNYVSVSIIDDDLISCEVAFVKGLRNLKIARYVFVAIAIFFAIKTIIIA